MIKSGRDKKNKGFTLVELIVVVAILAILATVAVPSVTGVVGDAKTSADEANLALYQAAIEMSVSDGSGYPENADEAVNAITENTDVNAPIEAPHSSSYDYFIYNTDTHKVSVGNSTSGDEVIISGVTP